MADKKALRLKIEGRVQGVNFRMATFHAAEKTGVFGWVRNMADGSVEAMIEGEADRVDEMVEWCKKGPPMASVTNVTVTEEAFSGRYSDFTIRYT